MNIKEFEGKAIFTEAGIRVPRGRIVRSPDEAWQAFQDLGGDNEVVLKAQVLAGKRGKAGGIVFADEDTVREKMAELLKKKIHGFSVREILVEEKLAIEEELYVAITVDRRNKCMSVICSPVGGMDIEEVAGQTPEKIFSLPIVDQALSLDQAVQMSSKLSTIPNVRKDIAGILIAMHRIVQEKDALLVEINPLVVTVQREVIAADSKIVIDENALFRQEQFRFEIDREEDKTDLEKEALKAGLAYVELDGTIGVIGNGAGLTMTMIDLIHHFGSEPANFLDIGGAARTHEMEQALDIVLQKPGVKGICINIFGGITHCDEIAEGIIDYLARKPIAVPIVVRMVGTNVAQATKMLEQKKIHVLDSLENAVEQAVELSSER